jgi:predicted nucleic acid-binding protein
MAARIAVDASVILRYLTGDEKTQSAAAADLFRAAEAGEVALVIPTATIQETVYVLERLYGLDAQSIAPKLISLLAIPNVIAPDARWLLEALQYYRTKSSDFGDALLCAYAQQEGWDVATFDQGLIQKFPELSACTPAEWLGKTSKQKNQGRN